MHNHASAVPGNGVVLLSSNGTIGWTSGCVPGLSANSTCGAVCVVPGYIEPPDVSCVCRRVPPAVAYRKSHAPAATLELGFHVQWVHNSNTFCSGVVCYSNNNEVISDNEWSATLSHVLTPPRSDVPHSQRCVPCFVVFHCST